MHLSKKAFTLIELIVVVTMIWILIMATTVYLWWADEKRKIIEAQWCASTIHWELNNFVFYALTSKNLKIDWDEVSGDEYIIDLWNSSSTCTEKCDKIFLILLKKTYKELSAKKTCHKNLDLRFSWNNNITDYISMTKWFKNIKVSSNSKNTQPFFLKFDNNNVVLTWNITILLCQDKDCNNSKEIGKYEIDWRSQTISLINCKYYNEEDPSKCELRDGEEPKLKEKTNDTENNG